METVSKIRRWVLVDGLSICEVSRRTGISRNTVRKYLRDENAEPHYRQRAVRRLRSLLDYELRLKGLYDADLGCTPRERRSMQGLYKVLVCEGYQGSYDSVRRYILRLKSKGCAVNGYIPLEYDAGNALQFDWSHELVTLAGVDAKVYAAHFRFCHFRKLFVAAYFRESQEMALDAFNRAFTFYGSVPRRVIIDKPKTMVAFIGKANERVFHPRFEALMSHYAVLPVACTPASGNEKGHVERQVQALRKQIFTPKLSFDALADLNAYLEAQCELQAQKPHPENKTCKVADFLMKSFVP